MGRGNAAKSVAFVERGISFVLCYVPVSPKSSLRLAGLQSGRDMWYYFASGFCRLFWLCQKPDAEDFPEIGGWNPSSMSRELYDGIIEQARASRHRFADARALLNASRRRCSMYIAGYAVECLLKTKLMHIYNCRNLRSLDVELHRRSLLPAHRTVFTHDLEELLKLSPGYNRMRQSPRVWMLFKEVNRWTSQWRYAAERITEADASGFLNAVEGFMRWIDNNI